MPAGRRKLGTRSNQRRAQRRGENAVNSGQALKELLRADVYFDRFSLELPVRTMAEST